MVKTFDWTPEPGKKWEWSRIEMMHRQDIAVSLEGIRQHIESVSRVDERMREENYVLKGALELMCEREEVETLFEETGDSMPLSEFTRRFYRYLGIRPEDAINRTNYLRAERKGRGYRVYLVTED